MKDIELIEKLELHDQPLTGIMFNINEQSIQLTIENSEKYQRYTLRFDGVKELRYDNYNFLDIEEVYGIYFNTDGVLKVKIMTLLGYSKPSLEISFAFERVTLSIDGLDKNDFKN